uniref:Uncharacterized protein n=1 Tax=Moniliophthora roreri TaxID=221103 RepID=A0A0W0ETX6_MONRR
MFFVFCKLV